MPDLPELAPVEPTSQNRVALQDQEVWLEALGSTSLRENVPDDISSR